MKPFVDVKSDIRLAALLHQGKRPDLSSLPPELSAAVRDIISQLFDGNRDNRPTAVNCYNILKFEFDILCEGKYDIFFSHLWAKKPFLKYIYRLLARMGYRVWYDINDMGHLLNEAMEKGIFDSKVRISHSISNSNFKVL